MKIAVLSGKGGTGKTFVSVNLAACATSAFYLDCDVEEPNGHLFLKPNNVKRKEVSTLLPSFDKDKCVGCYKCVDFCHFNALAFIKDKPIVFEQVCHACGGCTLVCPNGAIVEKERVIGTLECGTHNQITAITGILNLGEASGVPVIKAVLEEANVSDALTIIDCPPGSACTVMESIDSADYCILVAEPTIFGLHNFKMVYELVNLLGKPCGIIINKTEGDKTPLDEFCLQKNIPILCQIPYSEKLALVGANAQIACEIYPDVQIMFKNILNQVMLEVGQ